MTTLFISDLHLDVARPQVIAAFVEFLRQKAGTTSDLYILGDLFEAWIGDDAAAPALPIINALHQFTQSGSRLHIMHGNRDFLLGTQFAQAAGATLLPEQIVIDLYGVPTLLMHGDTLCTDDVSYQNFRQMVRNPAWQQDFLSRSIEQRLAMARQARSESKEQSQQKAEYIMDANPNAVVAAMAENRVNKLIHGHTHRPAVHALTIDGKAAERYVLGDWYDQGSVLICTPDNWQLKAFPLS